MSCVLYGMLAGCGLCLWATSPTAAIPERAPARARPPVIVAAGGRQGRGPSGVAVVVVAGRLVLPAADLVCCCLLRAAACCCVCCVLRVLRECVLLLRCCGRRGTCRPATGATGDRGAGGGASRLPPRRLGARRTGNSRGIRVSGIWYMVMWLYGRARTQAQEAQPQRL
jgi:hypothetical protein